MGDVNEPGPVAGRRRAAVPVDSGTATEGRRRATGSPPSQADAPRRGGLLGRLGRRRTA